LTYEAITRIIRPAPISFNETIAIGVLGLAVNVAGVRFLVVAATITIITVIPTRILTHDHDEAHRLQSDTCSLLLDIFM
jgi:Co/Zn/Cd efflux system component